MAGSSAAMAQRYEPFSKQHREQLALGTTVANLHPSGKKKPKARITVVVRKRPLSAEEASRQEGDILRLEAETSGTTICVEEPRKNVCGIPYIETHEYGFDRAYGETSSNQELYRSCVQPIVDAVFQTEARCACFAYGQTGSGKTYTMVGKPKQGGLYALINSRGSGAYIDPTEPEKQGVFEFAAQDCFRWLHQPEFDYYYGLYVSFFEIYCNKVYDLLNGRRLVRALETKTADGVVVKDLTVTKAEDCESLLRLIASGLSERVVGMNSKNNDSSRGHAILTLEVKSEHTHSLMGKLAFIDLAGSERGADTIQSKKQTQQDGAGINRSLLALKECIRALDAQSPHVPFRDSELTKVLRDMFMGSRARTVMIACVSPSSGCVDQTLNTLRYAERLMKVRRNCQPDIADAPRDKDGSKVRERLTDVEDDASSGSVNGGRCEEDDDDLQNSAEEDDSTQLPQSPAMSPNRGRPAYHADDDEPHPHAHASAGDGPASSLPPSTHSSREGNSRARAPSVRQWTRPGGDRSSKRSGAATKGHPTGGTSRDRRSKENVSNAPSEAKQQMVQPQQKQNQDQFNGRGSAKGEEYSDVSEGELEGSADVDSRNKHRGSTVSLGSSHVSSDSVGNLGRGRAGSHTGRNLGEHKTSSVTEGDDLPASGSGVNGNIEVVSAGTPVGQPSSEGATPQQQGQQLPQQQQQQHQHQQQGPLQTQHAAEPSRVIGSPPSSLVTDATTIRYGIPPVRMANSGTLNVQKIQKRMSSRREREDARPTTPHHPRTDSLYLTFGPNMGDVGSASKLQMTSIVGRASEDMGGRHTSGLASQPQQAEDALRKQSQPRENERESTWDEHSRQTLQTLADLSVSTKGVADEIAKVFAPNEADRIAAGANVLQARWRDFGLHHSLLGHYTSDNRAEKYEACKAILRNMYANFRAKDILLLSQRLSDKFQTEFGDYTRLHRECLKAQSYLGLTQGRMLKRLECDVRDASYAHDESYIGDMRLVIEQYLAIYIRLGEKLLHLEQMMALKDTLVDQYQKAVAAESSMVPQVSVGGVDSANAPVSMNRESKLSIRSSRDSQAPQVPPSSAATNNNNNLIPSSSSTPQYVSAAGGSTGADSSKLGNGRRITARTREGHIMQHTGGTIVNARGGGTGNLESFSKTTVIEASPPASTELMQTRRVSTGVQQLPTSTPMQSVNLQSFYSPQNQQLGMTRGNMMKATSDQLESTGSGASAFQQRQPQSSRGLAGRPVSPRQAQTASHAKSLQGLENTIGSSAGTTGPSSYGEVNNLMLSAQAPFETNVTYSTTAGLQSKFTREPHPLMNGPTAAAPVSGTGHKVSTARPSSKTPGFAALHANRLTYQQQRQSNDPGGSGYGGDKQMMQQMQQQQSSQSGLTIAPGSGGGGGSYSARETSQQFGASGVIMGSSSSSSASTMMMMTSSTASTTPSSSTVAPPASPQLRDDGTLNVPGSSSTAELMAAGTGKTKIRKYKKRPETSQSVL